MNLLSVINKIACYYTLKECQDLELELVGKCIKPHNRY